MNGIYGTIESKIGDPAANLADGSNSSLNPVDPTILICSRCSANWRLEIQRSIVGV